MPGDSIGANWTYRHGLDGRDYVHDAVEVAEVGLLLVAVVERHFSKLWSQPKFRPFGGKFAI